MTLYANALVALYLFACLCSQPLGAADATTAASATAAAAVDPVAASPWASARGSDQYGTWADLTLKGVSLRFRLIPAGTFQMGSPTDEAGRSQDESQHAVTLQHPFWLAENVETDFFTEVINGIDPMVINDLGFCPLHDLTWNHCQGILKALNGQIPGLAARLPTEAEWEYACRAGTTSSIPATSIDDIAWCKGWSAGGLELAVKRKKPNAWGLYDMLGLEDQWCSDWYADYPPGAQMDPIGPATGTLRVLRGGPSNLRSASRGRVDPAHAVDPCGFRICIPVQK